VTPELDAIPEFEGLLEAALERMRRDPHEMEQIVRRIAQAHRLLVLGQIAATVAHDLKNQLTVVTSCVGHLRQEGRPEDEEVGAEALAAAERAAATCRQVLSLARPARKQGEPFDVNAVLTRLAPLLRKLGPDDGAKIEVDLVLSPEPAWAVGDESEFSNAMLNLAINSCEAMPSGGRLALRTALVDVPAGPNAGRRCVRVEVVDDGAGIPADLLPTVFDPFVTTKTDGTGLGLASVRHAVERHGGAIKLSSQVGEGTSVTMLLPATDPAPARGAGDGET
jgi:signal transduction histidine kinase